MCLFFVSVWFHNNIQNPTQNPPVQTGILIINCTLCLFVVHFLPCKVSLGAMKGALQIKWIIIIIIEERSDWYIHWTMCSYFERLLTIIFTWTWEMGHFVVSNRWAIFRSFEVSLKQVNSLDCNVSYYLTLALYFGRLHLCFNYYKSSVTIWTTHAS